MLFRSGLGTEGRIEVGLITHLLTAYLVYEAISEGKLSLDTDVDISDYAYNLTANPYITNLPLEARRYTVEELLEASLLVSANSATIALAEKVAGSEENFVKMMKDKLKEWKIGKLCRSEIMLLRFNTEIFIFFQFFTQLMEFLAIQLEKFICNLFYAERIFKIIQCRMFRVCHAVNDKSFKSADCCMTRLIFAYKVRISLCRSQIFCCL